MKKEKIAINILTTFYISHKSDIKIFLKWILKEYPQNTRQHDPFIIQGRDEDANFPVDKY